MPSSEPEGSVQLADQQSASAFLHQALMSAVARFPAVLGDADFPAQPSAFRKTYPDAIARFEAARSASPDRALIARHLFGASQQQIVWESGGGSVPLAMALGEPVSPLALDQHTFPEGAGWTPSLVYRGRRWSALELLELADSLLERNVISAQAAGALQRIPEHLDADGKIDLSGRKIVVLGANAEMAPTRYLLEAGADLLWLDVVPPPLNWLRDTRFSGRLSWARDNVDLLSRPQEVLATIQAFAEDRPVDLGLYAYAPGQARELRLSATMNALMNALPAELIRSVTLLVSPSSPVGLDDVGARAMDLRKTRRPAWEGLLAGLRLLGSGSGRVHAGGGYATRSIVNTQGTSYQAAQYLEKVMAAECWATHGQLNGDAPAPLRVSANVAAITRTRSLDHPVFAAAFGGAAAFGVETFPPRLSRGMNGLLAVHDWLAPEHPVPGTVRVHGGIHSLPYALSDALMVAAVFGFVRAPKLLRGFFR